MDKAFSWIVNQHLQIHKILENLQVLAAGVLESKLLGKLKRFRGILKYLQFEKSGLIFMSRVEGEQEGSD